MVATWRLSRAAAERSPVGSAAYIAPSIETRLALRRETRRESQPRPRSRCELAAESDKLHTTCRLQWLNGRWFALMRARWAAYSSLASTDP